MHKCVSSMMCVFYVIMYKYAASSRLHANTSFTCTYVPSYFLVSLVRYLEKPHILAVQEAIVYKTSSFFNWHLH